ncbi:hypothetical protein SAMN02745120_0359 [Acetoanaerobium noterae]|uniref:Helix-turn-helix domain-containing protein n=1 Tax=Acetoanaerobium noterae TaxID=745369 RepID=A0A1T4ZT21_9FIRM|nr:helix-turn-helix domain-containing protein [Acetoanaerobium noterae]SKB25911.1 hypothetical protein SAMN02745120_0359 [Acetoanaerobium noterae]
MFEYMTVKEAAEKWGLSVRRVQFLCVEGRIEGAMKHASVWAIPKDADKPKDERIITGKYIKPKNNNQ